MSVIRFHHDETGYAAWLSAHPQGFVFNHFGTDDSRFNVIHQGSCRYLHRPKDEGRRTQVEKICSDELDPLVAFVRGLRADTGGWKYCGWCLPNKSTRSANSMGRVRSTRQSADRHINPLPEPYLPSSGDATPTRRITADDFTLWRPMRVLECLDIEPRLASWDAKTHRSQILLGAYLDRVQARFERHLRDPQRSLYLKLEVVHPPHVHLLRHYDLENYLWPVADRLRCPGIVLATAVKRHPQRPGDHSRIELGEAEPGAGFDMRNFHGVSIAGPPGSTPWKRALRQELIDAGVERAAEGPLTMVIALHAARPLTSWWNAWIDALGPILGEPVAGKPFNPSDDRIVRLEMHYTPSASPGGTTRLGFWWQVGNERVA